MNKSLVLQVAIWKEGKFYIAQCLDVDVSSFGRTKKSALKNLQEALELYFEDSNLQNLVKVEEPTLTKLKLQYA